MLCCKPFTPHAGTFGVLASVGQKQPVSSPTSVRNSFVLACCDVTVGIAIAFAKAAEGTCCSLSTSLWRALGGGLNEISLPKLCFVKQAEETKIKPEK